MLLVAVEFHADPNHRSRFAELAGALGRATNEEDGCRFFEIWSDLGETGRFLAYEGWDDAAALERHRGTPHVAAFKAAAAEIGATVVTASYFDGEPTSV